MVIHITLPHGEKKIKQKMSLEKKKKKSALGIPKKQPPAILHTENVYGR